MDYRNISTETLAERWMDQREVQNLMGRYVNYQLIRREKELFDRFWCQEHEPVLGLGNGFYRGREAVEGYYNAVYENTCRRSELMQNLFPDYLGKKSLIELHGVGSLYIDALSGGFVEVALDGETAKGIWSVMGMDSDIYEYGPYSFWAYGYIAGDFVKENGEWKVWHLRMIDDIRCPVGMNWGREWDLSSEEKAEFASLKGLSLPEPNVPVTIREPFYPGRKNAPLVRVPEPYNTFSETFSYGIEEGE